MGIRPSLSLGFVVIKDSGEFF